MVKYACTIQTGGLMALSIRNRMVEDIAKEVAKETGETITQATLVALEERLTRLKGRKKAKNLRDEILKISKRCSSLRVIDDRSPDKILGYDRHGGFGHGD
jgi:antitoxin VapB